MQSPEKRSPVGPAATTIMRSLDSDARLLEAHERLVDRGVLAPLSQDDEDVRQWLGWELASLIEGHFHHIVDVSSLGSAERLEWERRVTAPGDPPSLPISERSFGETSPPSLPVSERSFGGTRLRDPRLDDFRRPYWLLHGRDRAGTLAIESRLLGRSDVGISSLYVRPDLRRRGIATRALDAVYEVVLDVGADGLRIATSWCWQPAVRLYARAGLWVRNWKHSLVFARHEDLWPYRVEIEGTRATFSVLADGTWTSLLQAQNGGTLLRWTELPAYSALLEPYSRASVLAPGTFALHLALDGWPLVRSAELWERRYGWSDLGMPEGLGYKIAVFEAIDREHGFDVRTPRIPGLDYRIE